MIREPVIEINEAQKFAELMLRIRSREISHRLYFVLEWPNSTITNVVL